LNNLKYEVLKIKLKLGTAAALLKNSDIINEKDLKFTGVDIDLDYINRANYLIDYYKMGTTVKVFHESIYDFQEKGFDAGYFSGSFMLMPDPEKALKHVISLLKPGSKIYFTQTFEKKKSVVMEYMKPLLQYITTIDFGQVTYEPDFMKVLENVGMKVIINEEMYSNNYRAARLIVATLESQQ
jgi:ubiquinone/menaquinone biosynthesis C-methylase UbiE